jgi:hypothetical protein
MAKNVRKIANRLGARVVGKVPDVGGGAFGAARLAAQLRDRLVPSSGERPGRPTDPTWVNRPKVPMSDATLERLEELAQRLSTPDRSVSPMQVAAQLLESSVERLSEQQHVVAK